MCVSKQYTTVLVAALCCATVSSSDLVSRRRLAFPPFSALADLITKSEKSSRRLSSAENLSKSEYSSSPETENYRRLRSDEKQLGARICGIRGTSARIAIFEPVNEEYFSVSKDHSRCKGKCDGFHKLQQFLNYWSVFCPSCRGDGFHPPNEFNNWRKMPCQNCNSCKTCNGKGGTPCEKWECTYRKFIGKHPCPRACKKCRVSTAGGNKVDDNCPKGGEHEWKSECLKACPDCSEEQLTHAKIPARRIGGQFGYRYSSGYTISSCTKWGTGMGNHKDFIGLTVRCYTCEAACENCAGTGNTEKDSTKSKPCTSSRTRCDDCRGSGIVRSGENDATIAAVDGDKMTIDVDFDPNGESDIATIPLAWVTRVNVDAHSDKRYLQLTGLYRDENGYLRKKPSRRRLTSSSDSSSSNYYEDSNSSSHYGDSNSSSYYGDYYSSSSSSYSEDSSSGSTYVSESASSSQGQATTLGEPPAP